jgi:type I restriction enzyme S subunit
MYDTAALKMSILDINTAFNQAIAGVKPHENIHLKFILYAIDSIRFEILHQRRGVRQKNISLAKIKNIRLPIPQVSEQQGIVAILDKAFEGIDRAIALLLSPLKTKAVHGKPVITNTMPLSTS